MEGDKTGPVGEEQGWGGKASTTRYRVLFPPAGTSDKFCLFVFSLRTTSNIFCNLARAWHPSKDFV